MADEKKDGLFERVSSQAAGLAKVSAPAEALSDLVSSTLRGAIDIGSELDSTAKGIVMGVLRGMDAKGEEALRMLAAAATAVVHHTADRGGNLAAATKGLVLGAIASAKAIEVDVDKAASAAARGALDGATQAGSVTVERVMTALKEPIGGRKIVLPEPLAL